MIAYKNINRGEACCPPTKIGPLNRSAYKNTLYFSRQTSPLFPFLPSRLLHSPAAAPLTPSLLDLLGVGRGRLASSGAGRAVAGRTVAAPLPPSLLDLAGGGRGEASGRCRGADGDSSPPPSLPDLAGGGRLVVRPYGGSGGMERRMWRSVTAVATGIDGKDGGGGVFSPPSSQIRWRGGRVNW